VAAQIAGSVVFLILAGLLFQHLTHLESLDLGFARDHLLLVDIDGQSTGYNATQALSVYTAIETRLRSLPSVQSVAQSVVKPFGGVILNVNIAAEGGEDSLSAERVLAQANFVSAGFFNTLAIPAIRGSSFTDEDAASVKPIAIVSDIMATRLWPNEDAIGKRFRSGIDTERWIEVVGVVKSIKQSEGFQPLKPPPPQFFMPMGSAASRIRTFYVRTLVPPESLASTVRSEIRSIDPNVAINHVATMEQQVTQSPNGFGIARMFVYIAVALGLLALLLALVGTYGALSFMVGEQAHEIGIRIALGASGSAVLNIVLQHGLGLALKGVAAGIVLAALAGRLLQTIMPDVSPFDPVVLTTVPLLLLTMAFVTCLIPARKATRIQPILTLKSE
jgi:putative ABC transport system permease protein